MLRMACFLLAAGLAFGLAGCSGGSTGDAPKAQDKGVNLKPLPPPGAPGGGPAAKPGQPGKPAGSASGASAQ